MRGYVGNDAFVAYLGDNLMKGEIKKNVQYFKTSDLDAMILLCKIKNPQRFGVAKFDGKGKLIGLVEKAQRPAQRLRPSRNLLFQASDLQDDKTAKALMAKRTRALD